MKSSVNIINCIMGQVQGVWENLMEDEGNFAVFIVNIRKTNNNRETDL